MSIRVCSLLRTGPLFFSNPLHSSQCRAFSLSAPSYSSEGIEDDGLPKDYKLKTIKTGSRRLDTFVNRAVGKSSSQVEKMILSGKVRVNDEVHTKKSYNISKGDLIDVWQKAYADNTELAEVDRLEAVDYTVTAAGYDIQVKHWRKFLVDNWRSSN